MRLQLQQLSRKLTTQDIMDIYNAAAHSVDSDIFYTVIHHLPTRCKTYNNLHFLTLSLLRGSPLTSKIVWR